MVHSVSRWTRSVQVKLWDLLRTRAILERLRDVITTRRYTNHVYLYLTLHSRTDWSTSFGGSDVTARSESDENLNRLWREAPVVNNSDGWEGRRGRGDVGIWLLFDKREKAVRATKGLQLLSFVRAPICLFVADISSCVVFATIHRPTFMQLIMATIILARRPSSA